MTEDSPDKPQDPGRPDRPRRPVGQGVPPSPGGGGLGPASRPTPDEEPWQQDESGGEEGLSWGDDEDRDQDPWRQEMADEWDQEEDWDEAYDGQEEPEELGGYAEESWDGSALSESVEEPAAEAHDTAAATAVETRPSRPRGPAKRRRGRTREEEAEIEAATMTLGEHLEELRKRLIWALLGLLVTTIVTVIFAKQLLLNQLNAPYFAVARKLNREMAEKIADQIRTRRQKLKISPKELAEAVGISEKRLALIESGRSKSPPHESMLEPIEEELKLTDNELTSLARQVMETKFIAVKAISPFLTYFKVALLGGLILASPWVFYQLWMFVAAGLYRSERRIVHMGLPFSVVLFVAGAVFFLKIVAYAMLLFFLKFARWLNVAPYITLQNHIGLMVRMMVVFGLAFQMPLVVFILGKIGLVSVKTLSRYRRHVIVAMLIVAAVFTSPSPVDQILLAIPMWLLYELGVLMVWMSERRRAQEEEDYDDLEPAD